MMLVASFFRHSEELELSSFNGERLFFALEIIIEVFVGMQFTIFF